MGPSDWHWAPCSIPQLWLKPAEQEHPAAHRWRELGVPRGRNGKWPHLAWGGSEPGTARAGRGSGKAMSAAAQISGLTTQSCFYGPRLEC